MKYIWIVAILCGIVLVWAIGSRLYVNTLEQPDYTVVASHSRYEVREYAPYITAQVTVPNDGRGLNNGFSQVAGYIFGGNVAQQSIAMTSPVLESNESSGAAIAMTSPVLEQNESGQKTVAFVLPRQWTLETLPVPKNKNVTIKQHPAQTLAVATYFEVTRGGRKDHAEAKLRKDLIADGYTASGVAMFAGYDPPSTPFFARRNEVLIPIGTLRKM